MRQRVERQIDWTKVVVGSVLLFYLFTFLPLTVSAQPASRKKKPGNTAVTPNRRTQPQQRTQGQLTQRARLMFPTAIDMPEDVVWRRDIYREVDLTQDANGGLYYPVQPVGREMNLFTYIFKLVQNGYIPAYEYRLDGNEVFSDSAKVDFKTLLADHSIFYEEREGKVHVDNSDIPSSEVTMYYLKECAYYDQGNSTFHRKVLALCPIMLREGDFGGEATKYPLFWVKYSDLEPFLSRQTVMTSDKNNAATMSMDDYFTLNKYKGKIYKTNNMLGKTLAQIAGGDSTKLSAEQQRIEEELEQFRKNIFGDPLKRDSLDSLANNNPQNIKAAAKAKAKRQPRTKAEKTSKKRSSSSSASTNSAARVTVRRQRH
jgi:gliding motility associated protien GldN